MMRFLMATLFLVTSTLLSPQSVKQGGSSTLSGSTEAQKIAQLDSQIENLRQDLRIPALSAALVKDQKVLWSKGFGYADLENKIPATADTSYHLASLTKTFASTLLMQLDQEGKVSLEDPVSRYGINLDSNGVIRVKHLLSHTSEGNPGEHYRYNGNRFSDLDKVIQKATGRSFAELLITQILNPLGMTETAPNVPPVVETKSPPGVARALEDEVKAAVMDLFQGFNTGSIEQVERHLSRQQNGFRGDGGFLTIYADPEELRNLKAKGIKLNIQISSLQAGVYENTAVTTFFSSVTVEFPDQSRQHNGPWRMSMIWNKREGTWKLVHTHQSTLTVPLITEEQDQRYSLVLKSLAQPYELDSSFNIRKSAYPPTFSTAAGLISSVLDMAKYDIAIDQNKFLTRETQQLAFTPTTSTQGETLPYGLGWFTQNYKGVKLIWHYGYWTCNSSLILKVPDRNITFIAMANTNNLSRPTDLGAGNVLHSPIGLAFLKTFIFPELFGEALPEIDWKSPSAQLKGRIKALTEKPYADVYSRELINQASVYSSVGKTADAARLFETYGALYSRGLPDDLSKKAALVQIVQVGDNEDRSVSFELKQQLKVRIFAQGEAGDGDLADSGWIEKADTGETIWKMNRPETVDAGGAPKNRKVDKAIELPVGKYKLRYKSDDSHSYNRWNSTPPDVYFWGIALYANE
ncbi:MAG: serine hydrolase [Acidobacteriia bacterium]|nr:serine hydrolase [Terriglobia bacterium]